MTHRTKYSWDEKMKVLSDYDNGKQSKRIAEQYHIPISTVLYFIRNRSRFENGDPDALTTPNATSATGDHQTNNSKKIRIESDPTSTAASSESSQTIITAIGTQQPNQSWNPNQPQARSSNNNINNNNNVRRRRRHKPLSSSSSSSNNTGGTGNNPRRRIKQHNNVHNDDDDEHSGSANPYMNRIRKIPYDMKLKIILAWENRDRSAGGVGWSMKKIAESFGVSTRSVSRCIADRNRLKGLQTGNLQAANPAPTASTAAINNMQSEQTPAQPPSQQLPEQMPNTNNNTNHNDYQFEQNLHQNQCGPSLLDDDDEPEDDDVDLDEDDEEMDDIDDVNDDIVNHVASQSNTITNNLTEHKPEQQHSTTTNQLQDSNNNIWPNSNILEDVAKNNNYETQKKLSSNNKDNNQQDIKSDSVATNSNPVQQQQLESVADVTNKNADSKMSMENNNNNNNHVEVNEEMNNDEDLVLSGSNSASKISKDHSTNNRQQQTSNHQNQQQQHHQQSNQELSSLDQELVDSINDVFDKLAHIRMIAQQRHRNGLMCARLSLIATHFTDALLATATKFVDRFSINGSLVNNHHYHHHHRYPSSSNHHHAIINGFTKRSKHHHSHHHQ